MATPAHRHWCHLNVCGGIDHIRVCPSGSSSSPCHLPCREIVRERDYMGVSLIPVLIDPVVWGFLCGRWTYSFSLGIISLRLDKEILSDCFCFWNKLGSWLFSWPDGFNAWFTLCSTFTNLPRLRVFSWHLSSPGTVPFAHKSLFFCY